MIVLLHISVENLLHEFLVVGTLPLTPFKNSDV